MNLLDEPPPGSVAIVPVAADELERWLADQPDTVRRWVSSVGFDAQPGSACVLPADDGSLERAVVGRADSVWGWAALPSRLPAADYHLEPGLAREDSDRAALGWALASYSFDRAGASDATDTEPVARLAWPEASDRDATKRAVEATFLVRDWINAPASELGPAELAGRCQAVAEAHGATFRTVVGDALLDEGFPAIHAVGRAAATDRAPRLIDVTWGDRDAPKLTLAGKGVCFDTGGLNLKPASSMKLMKKDMGGAAHVWGLAQMIMAAALPVRLRVLVPAVENSVSGSAYRPLDVVPTRNGKTIEVGHTDAEGRVVLADALEEASRDRPDMLLDFATLTGAARVALGPELPALFANDDTLAAGMLEHADQQEDPLWRMPLWQPYRSMIDGKVADITNSADGSFGGAITAALFLQEFVGSGIPWAHIDVMAWNPSSRPGRPEGGEAMGLRAAFAFIEERFRDPSSSPANSSE